jgi:TRAP-type C4-dicarboxylate transport system permease small subunit
MHYQRRDIVVDYVVRRFAVVGRTTARVVTNVLIAIMLAIALAQMPRIVRLQSGIINMVNVPRYMLSVPFFISAALILLDTIVDTARALAGVPLVIETPAEIEIDG